MTPYWDKKKKKIRYQSRYLGVQMEKSIEKARMHLPRDILVYGPFIPVMRIIREMDIELDSMRLDRLYS